MKVFLNKRLLAVLPFADLPIVDKPWNPNDDSDADIFAEILGDDTLETEAGRAKMKRAHLWWDGEGTTLAGYKLKVARRDTDGEIKVFFPQLASRVGIINGARGGVDIGADDKRGAFNHAVRYYDKLPDKEPPDFQGSQHKEKKRKRPLSMGFSRGVELEDDSTEDAGFVWVQVAHTGEFEGYRGGAQPFEFTKEHFDQMVRNVREHPSFNAGDDGFGSKGVIPWDFNHASEMDPTMGNLPLNGAPSHGWTADLQVREGEGGRSELWALTQWLEPARTYIKEGRVRWASLAVTFEAVHPETGANIGAIITSIALTNTPFIEGMADLAASKQAKLFGFFDSADNREEAVQSIRDLLQVPQTQPTPEVLSQLQRLAGWIETGERPEGIDIDGIVSGLRRILNLPVLSSPAEVVSGSIAVLSEPTDDNASTNDNTGLPQQQTTTRKPMEELIKLLASTLKVEPKHEAVVQACVLLQESAATADSVRDKLKALAAALGVEDVEMAVERVAELITKATQLEEVMPELLALRETVAAIEEESAEADVDAVINARGWDESLKGALVMERKAIEPTTEHKTKHEAFLAKYPIDKQAVPAVAAVQPPRAALTTTPAGGQVAAPAAQQMQVSADGSKVVFGPGARTAEQGPEVLKIEGPINLAAYPGVNHTDKALKFLASRYAGWDKLKWEEKCLVAYNFKKQPGVTFDPAVIAA